MSGMKNLTLEAVAAACESKLRGQVRFSGELQSVVIDSRQVEAGSLFICTRGNRVDGHDFIAAARDMGVAGIVCERMPDVDIPYILVDDSFAALRRIAEYYRRSLDIKVIGITGSVGKTGAKEFIASSLSRRFCTHKTAGNFNNEIGVPLTVLGIRDEHQIAVLEMGISDFGEMRRLARIVRPDIAVFTRIGDSHLETLGDRMGVLRAKAEMLEFLPEGGTVIINGDDEILADFGAALERKSSSKSLSNAPSDMPSNAQNTLRSNLLSYGEHNNNDIFLDQLEILGLDGVQVRIGIKRSGEIISARIPLPGKSNVYHALAAAAVGSLLGLSPSQIADGIESVAPVAGRAHIIRAERGTIIDDCYNANPQSMSNALSLLRGADGRKAAVLGDMFDLGEKERELHRMIGEKAIEEGVDTLICIGSRMRHAYEAASAMVARKGLGVTARRFSDKKEFLTHMSEILVDGDTVLVKASHGMEFNELVEELRAFFL